MAGLGGSAGNLALWLHLRRKDGLGGTSAPEILAPEGEGPLLLIHLPQGEDDPAALTAVVGALLSARKDLRLAFSGGNRLPSTQSGAGSVNLPALSSPAAVSAALALLAPKALLLFGADLPAALVTGASDAGIPIIMAEARLEGKLSRGLWRDTITRGLLARIDRILVPDLQTDALVRRLGADEDRIEMIGPVTDTQAPLRGNEAERQALAQVLRGRHIWFAASPTLPEALAVIDAHHDLLQYNHRALLILAAPPEGTLGEILAACDARGLAPILRTDDEDPQPDDHVLIAEEDDEMGLWYRLAPVTFVGGTLIGGNAYPARHPFEPAALGSAIIHGPIPGRYDAAWAQLEGAHAARKVPDAAGLKQAVSDLASAELAAILAQNAWTVSTGGAAVVRRIQSEVLGQIGEKP